MAYIIKGTTVISDAGAIDSAQSKIIANSSLTLAARIYSPVQGSTSGYTSGGEIGSLNMVNTIDKFPFAADGNATDVGDLTAPTRRAAAGQSSAESGYTSGGLAYPGPFAYLNVIDKFPFAANANATDVGDLTQARHDPTGQSSEENGYTSGGSTSIPNVLQNTIDKFPFAANANATDVGNLTVQKNSLAGQSSTVSGYTSGGGAPGNVTTNVIEKFPFATNANAADVGDLTRVSVSPIGQASDVSGYTSGGVSPPVSPPIVNVIDKFPFASNANATDVGDLTQARTIAAGQSSTSSGYTSGGSAPAYANTIDKFSFAADANATDVGDLTQARFGPAGQQV